MTLEQLVPSLEVCQQLKAAGFPQDTALAWYPEHCDDYEAKAPTSLWPDEWKRIAVGQPVVCVREEMEDHESLCAAPTAEEILKELPLFLNKVIHEQLCVTREENTPACNGWLVGWWSMDIHGVLGGVGEKSLSRVAAKSYLWWKKEVAG